MERYYKYSKVQQIFGECPVLCRRTFKRQEQSHFCGKPEALPLYEAFEQKVFSEVDGVKVKVQKTQIAFSNRHNFVFVSFLPVRKAKARPEVYIVVTFGLGYRAESPRIDAAAEPYSGRWTHHVLISGAGEIDGELMGWVKEAAVFSDSKR